MLFSFLLFAEIEAKEACDWLRAAGFPQYVQLFKGKYGAVSVMLCHTPRRVNSEMIQTKSKPCHRQRLIVSFVLFLRQTAGFPLTLSGRSVITTSWIKMPSTHSAGNTLMQITSISKCGHNIMNSFYNLM